MKAYIVSDKYVSVDEVKVWARSAREALALAEQASFIPDEALGVEDYNTYVERHYQPTVRREKEA